jgi:N-acetylglutamate synthase-like GNAT family acetyltransferase
MEVREANRAELDEVKAIIDAAEEMDTDPSTYTIEYFEALLDDHLVLVATEAAESDPVIGVCFGKYNRDEDWADMIGLAVKEGHRHAGIGTALVERFEREVEKRDISTIDLFADESRRTFFDELDYKEGRTYVAFRKHLK